MRGEIEEATEDGDGLDDHLLQTSEGPLVHPLGCESSGEEIVQIFPSTGFY
jgi:hypothetical protein